MFLGKDVLKTYSSVTGEHPYRSAISITLQCNLIEIALRHGCSTVNLLHIFRTPFPKNTSIWLLLTECTCYCKNAKIPKLQVTLTSEESGKSRTVSLYCVNKDITHSTEKV